LRAYSSPDLIRSISSISSNFNCSLIQELKLLNNFDRLSAGIKRKLKDILTIQQEYVLQKGLKEGIVEEENVDDI
jgi:hypothetical protein